MKFVFIFLRASLSVSVSQSICHRIRMVLPGVIYIVQLPLTDGPMWLFSVWKLVLIYAAPTNNRTQVVLPGVKV